MDKVPARIQHQIKSRINLINLKNGNLKLTKQREKWEKQIIMTESTRPKKELKLDSLIGCKTLCSCIYDALFNSNNS